jgi:hypothetical protein
MKLLCGLLLAACLLCGCGESLEKKIVGTWKVDTAKTQFEGKMDEIEKKQMMAIMESMSLELKEDKTFNMEVIFPIEGTWALAGNKLSLTPKTKPGETVKMAANAFDVDASGTTMSAKVEEKPAGTLVLTKSDAAK